MASASFEDLYQLGLAEAVTKRPDLQFNEGDVTDMLLLAAAAMAGKNEQTSAENLRKTFVDGAEGDDLTTLADDHFDIQRQLATAAQVVLSFTRTSGAGAGTIDAGAEVATAVDAQGNDVRFFSDEDLAYGAGENGPKTVSATAQNTGPEGNVVAGAISRIITVLFDTTFSVTNAADAGGGNLEETDDSVRDHIRERPASLRRATKQALTFGAKEVEAVRVATTTENTATGQVNTSVSDDAGSSTAQMINDVIRELENWRAAGIPVSVIGGTVILAGMTLTLTLDESADVGTLRQFVIDAVTAEIAKLSIGETLYDSMIIAAARNVAPDLIFDVTISGVTGVTLDTAPASNELIRAGVITVVEA